MKDEFGTRAAGVQCSGLVLKTEHRTLRTSSSLAPRHSPLFLYFLLFCSPGPRLSNASAACSKLTVFDKSVTRWAACISDSARKRKFTRLVRYVFDCACLRLKIAGNLYTVKDQRRPARNAARHTPCAAGLNVSGTRRVPLAGPFSASADGTRRVPNTSRSGNRHYNIYLNGCIDQDVHHILGGRCAATPPKTSDASCAGCTMRACGTAPFGE